ncbi:hypothetical protein ACFFIG_00750, partial [Paraburkholderia rhizosphaerae]
TANPATRRGFGVYGPKTLTLRPHGKRPRPCHGGSLAHCAAGRKLLIFKSFRLYLLQEFDISKLIRIPNIDRIHLEKQTAVRVAVDQQLRIA